MPEAQRLTTSENAAKSSVIHVQSMDRLSYLNLQLANVRLIGAAAVEMLIFICQKHVKLVEFLENRSLRSPDSQLLEKFWNYEKSSPASGLLRLEYVSVDMISSIKHVSSLRTNQFREYITASSGVDSSRLVVIAESSDSQRSRLRVHLSKNGSFAEEKRLSGINNNEIKE